MARNIDLFSIYVAKVLDVLFDSFPIPKQLLTKDFVESVAFDKWLKATDEVLAGVHDPGNPFARAEASSRESEKLSEAIRNQQHREQVFTGTMRFLIAEGFVRCDEQFSDFTLHASCQLTSKGLLHLNCEFKDKQIGESGSSIIDAIKRRFSSSSSVEGATASQVFVGLITRYLLG